MLQHVNDTMLTPREIGMEKVTGQRVRWKKGGRNDCSSFDDDA